MKPRKITVTLEVLTPSKLSDLKKKENWNFLLSRQGGFPQLDGTKVTQATAMVIQEDE